MAKNKPRLTRKQRRIKAQCKRERRIGLGKGRRKSDFVPLPEMSHRYKPLPRVEMDARDIVLQSIADLDRRDW